MNRRLLIVCAVMFLVAMAVPAFAAVQNVKVSGDIDAKWIIRDNFSLGQQSATFVGSKDNQNYLNTIARVRVDADLTDNVSATIRLLNERDWNDEGSTGTSSSSAGATGDTSVYLDLAYVTLKEMLYSPLTVIIGRQNLRYGNAFIIGDPDTNRLAAARSGVQARDLSARKAFDAIRMILNYDPLTVDIIYSKIGAGAIRSTAAIDSTKDDIDLYGINANYKLGDKYNTVAEAYLFTKKDNNTTAGVAGTKGDTIYNPGLRVSTNPIKGLNLQGEVAWQRGNKAGASGASTVNDNRRREATAWQIIVTYALQVEKLMKYSPVAGLEYTHYSGDKNPTRSGAEPSADKNAREDTYRHWDPMFEDQAGGKIYNVLFIATDNNIFNANVSFKPIEDVSLRLDWTTLYLDKKLPWDGVASGGGTTAMTLYQTGGNSTSVTTMNTDEKHLGQEIDAMLTYDYTEDVQFGLNVGAFVPGKAFTKLVSKKNATQAIASCKVVF